MTGRRGIEQLRGLNGETLQAIAELERRSLLADGGRLKLEWSTLRRRSGDDVEDVVWWEDDQLVGFAGLYAFGAPTVEIAGMVDPAWRQRGIATQLLDAALSLSVARHYSTALLVTPRDSAGARALAARRRAPLHHSEHVLALVTDPAGGPEDPDLTLRPAMVDDADVIGRLLTEGFGHPPGDVAAELATDRGQTLLALHQGQPIGTIRLTREEGGAGVYGFVVAEELRGRGFGRDILRRVCRQLRHDGADRIQLEVAVDNDRALGLYTSLGFTQVHTEDYYDLGLPVSG